MPASAGRLEADIRFERLGGWERFETLFLTDLIFFLVISTFLISAT